MAAVTSVSFAALKAATPSSCNSSSSNSSSSASFTSRDNVAFRLRSSNFSSLGVHQPRRLVVHCTSSPTSPSELPTVAETKSKFLAAYKRPIPSIYNNVLQELIVQQHLVRYKKTYKYDAVFALGFVTVYDQLMDGYPSEEDRIAIFEAYIKALNEDPEQYRKDAQKLEEWARGQTSTSLLEFSAREGEIEDILKDISARAADGTFSYSRFFTVGLFRLLELANASEPTILEKLCKALNVNKKSVDRDLDVYRNLLTKLVQAKDLLKEYIEREKKKREERAAEVPKANEAITK